MKQQNVKKLSLNKSTIQDLQVALNSEELNMVHGGSATTNPATTEPPIFC